MRRWGECVVWGLVRPAEAAEVGDEVEDVVETVGEGTRERLPDVGLVWGVGWNRFLISPDLGVVGFWVVGRGDDRLRYFGHWMKRFEAVHCGAIESGSFPLGVLDEGFVVFLGHIGSFLPFDSLVIFSAVVEDQ